MKESFQNSGGIGETWRLARECVSIKDIEDNIYEIEVRVLELGRHGRSLRFDKRSGGIEGVEDKKIRIGFVL